MIDWADVNSIQKEKLELEVKLNVLLKSENKSEDDVSALKSEILYLDKKIKRILGKNEVDRQAEVKNKNTVDIANVRNKKRYYEFKEKYNKISNMTIATNHIISVLKKLSEKQNEETIDKSAEYVKVRV